MPGRLRNNNRPGDPNSARRCGAKTRSGAPCRGPAMRNGRCRMHGGLSTGPKTPEGLERSRTARWKHGRYSREARQRRRLMRSVIETFKASREALKGAMDETLPEPIRDLALEQFERLRGVPQRLVDEASELSQTLSRREAERDASLRPPE